MIQDPTNQYIATILSQWEISGKKLLEIGCGKGRITRNLAEHAKEVIATDPDLSALEQARSTITAYNVRFMHAPAGLPDLSAGAFDAILYTLSFHHVPVAEMAYNLYKAAALLNHAGVIIIIEPGDGGSLTYAKERFGVGSGDERPAKAAAIRAMNSMDGWKVSDTVHFRTMFQFADEEDFFISMLPDFRQRDESFLLEVKEFLDLHWTDAGIILDADRRLNILYPS